MTKGTKRYHDRMEADLTRLSALEARCGDVEGMAKGAWEANSHLPWDMLPAEEKERLINHARAVSRFLKEGK